MIKVYQIPGKLLPNTVRRFIKRAFFTVIILCAGAMASLGAAIASFAPAKGPVGTMVTLKGSGLLGATVVNIGGVPAIIISKANTLIVAMVMRGAATGAISITISGGTATAAGNFTVTETPYPIAQQGRKLVDGAAQYDLYGNNADFYQTEQGTSVALSADGNTAMVGNGYSSISRSGVVFYVRDNFGRWRADSKTIITEAVGSGCSVALSADGNTAIVGARLTGGLRAAILTKKNGSWSNPNIQLLSNATKVSITADGNTVLINGGGPRGADGRVSMFMRNGSGWQSIPAPHTTNYRFFGAKYDFAVAPVGADAAISGDGKTVAMLAESFGFPGYTVIYTRATRTSNKWTPQKLLPEFDNIYLSGDGNTLIGGHVFLDAMSIYTRNGNDWVWKQQLNEHGAVAMSEDGSTLMLPRGATVYTLENGLYVKKGELKPGSNAVSVAVSADGTTALTGDPTDNTTPKKVVLEEFAGEYHDRQPQPLGGAYAFSSSQPEVAASAITFANITGTTTSVSWANGGGTGRAVFIKDTTAGEPVPADIYYSSNVRYHSGYPIGNTGWYCIYNGTGSTVNVIGLATNKTYRVAVMEYKGTVDKPLFLQTEIAPANVTTPLTPPTGYATGLAFSNTAATSTTLSWVSSNGSARAVFLKLGTSGALNVMQGTTYTANNTFGQGTQVGTNGWYCVYNGTGNTVGLSGLSALSTYRAIVIEYNGTAGTEMYNLERYNAANITTKAAPATLLTTNQKRLLMAQDVLAESTTPELNIHQGMSPNGDGANDVFTIDGIGAYPQNTVKILNSNGDVIYSATGYDNYLKAFDGRSAKGELQKAGTYFYSLEYKKGAETIRKTGYLILKF